jgi:hypothetical protein
MKAISKRLNRIRHSPENSTPYAIIFPLPSSSPMNRISEHALNTFPNATVELRAVPAQKGGLCEHRAKTPSDQTQSIREANGNQHMLSQGEVIYPWHIHSANTHHLAVRSASTRPRQTPRSEHLMIVSHVPPSLASSSPPNPPARELLLIPRRSSLRMSRKIFPPGVWIASFAGFLALPFVDELKLEPWALELVILMALLGRTKGMGLVPPGFEEGVIGPAPSELGCWRTAKTNVLLSANRWH